MRNDDHRLNQPKPEQPFQQPQEPGYEHPPGEEAEEKESVLCAHLFEGDKDQPNPVGSYDYPIWNAERIRS